MGGLGGFLSGPGSRAAAYVCLLLAVALNVYQRVRGAESETLRTVSLVLLVAGALLLLGRIAAHAMRRRR